VAKSISALAKASKKDLIRLQAEADFLFFIRLIHPNRVLGLVHEDLGRWLTRQDRKSHQLVLMPRDHQKSAIAGYYAAWEITRNPAIRILYISSTSNLAIKQLKFIKDILTSDIYRFYWPEMVNPDESKREKWTESEISVDHPKRKEEIVRDPTVFLGGLTTSLTGLHCDLTIMDDVVVIENAYTEEGRAKVKLQYSLLASIEGTEARGLVVGTRYHPKDLYNDLLEKEVEVYNEEGEIASSEPLYEVFERVVEENGQFLWPRQQRKDGKWFGFSADVLARKRAQYIDATQFRAQYYNDPNDVSEAPISPDTFQYYDAKYLTRESGYWYFKQHRLNVFAAIDFAFSLAKRADYTAIVVIGVDGNQNYYILDIDRFKTDKISEYFGHILRLHQKWDFRKLRAEVTSGQKAIVESLKLDHIRKHGLALSVQEERPTRHDGTKDERITATLQPKYDNHEIWHFRGGYCESLEQELIRRNPPHDDIKDALSNAIAAAVAPTFSPKQQVPFSQMTHSRFGGIA
jgi:phage terminase large subunit-like protein